MIKITKPILQKALIAGFFSAFTIGVLTVLTYKSTLGYFIAASFGSSMVLLFGFPESPFAQPKNVFFGHLLTALVGVIFVNFIPLPIYINIALAVGAGVFFMPARKLFDKCGFRLCKPFAHYQEDVNSIYLTKIINE